MLKESRTDRPGTDADFCQRLIEGLKGGISATVPGIQVERFSFTFSSEARGLFGQLLGGGISDGVGGGIGDDIQNPNGYRSLLSRVTHDTCELEGREVRLLIEKLGQGRSSELHVKALGEIFSQQMNHLAGTPEHPRTFVLRRLFSTEGEVVCGMRCLEPFKDESVEANSLLNKLYFAQNRAPSPTPSAGGAYRDLFVSRGELKAAFKAISTSTSSPADRLVEMTDERSLLIDMCLSVQKAIDLFIDRTYQRIPGTQIRVQAGRAVSKVLIEHALLTSNRYELIESVRSGAVMAAIGVNALSDNALDERGLGYEQLGVELDWEDMAKTGFRIIGLAAALTRGETRYAEVLSAYGVDRLSVQAGRTEELLALCRKAWRFRPQLQDGRGYVIEGDALKDLGNSLNEILNWCNNSGGSTTRSRIE